MTAAWKLVALLVAALLLAGCSEEPRPRFDEPTESPSATASSSAPPEREPWQVKSRAGAEAFAEHWIDTFNQAQSTGDTSELVALSAPGCQSCQGIIDRIKSVVADGGSFQGKGWRLLDANATPLEGSRTSVALNVRRNAQTVRESAGEPPQTFPPSKGIYRADLQWHGSAWLLNELVDFE